MGSNGEHSSDLLGNGVSYEVVACNESMRAHVQHTRHGIFRPDVGMAEVHKLCLQSEVVATVPEAPVRSVRMQSTFRAHSKTQKDARMQST